MSRVSIEIDGDIALAMDACRITMARSSLLHFMQYMYLKDGREFQIGRHTREICAKLDSALFRLFYHGQSSYIVCSLVYRHGKSEIFSRYLPPYVIGKFGVEPFRTQNNRQNIALETILATHTASLSEGFSKDARNILQHPAYAEVFPGVELAKDSKAADEWAVLDKSFDRRLRVEKEFGQSDAAKTALNVPIFKMHAIGAGGAIHGRGSCLSIVDDLLRGREDAESETLRSKAWNSLTTDILTRLAPKHIVFLVGTRWHVDDPIGKIYEKNDPESSKYDPEFPKFEPLVYKARNDDGTYLFPERFPPEWYIRQFATLGPYSAAALLQSEPVAKGGNLLPTDKVQYIDSLPISVLDSALYCRFWDLASSDKEMVKDDPDYTVGAKGFIWFDNAHPSDQEDELKLKMRFFVVDVRYIQAEAIRRNELILSSSRSDGPRTWQGIEAQGGYKDAATTLQTILKGVSIVHKINVSRDKFSRIENALHVPMDANQVCFLRGSWNGFVSQQLSQFPSGKHDDVPDAIAGLFNMCWQRALVALRSGYVGGGGFSGGRGRVKRQQTRGPAE